MGKKVSGIVELMVASISALLVRQFDFVKESPAASWFCDDDGNPKYTALEWDRAYGYPDVLIPSVLDRVIMVVCGDPDEPASTKPGDPNRAEVFGALGRAALELAEARKKEQEAGTARYAWYHATAEDFQGTGELARQLFSHVDGARIFNTSVPAGTDPATGEPRHRNGTFVSIPEIDSQGPRQRRAALI